MADRRRYQAATLQDVALLAAVRAIPRTGPVPAAATDAVIAALAAAVRLPSDRAQPAHARAQATAGAPVEPDNACLLAAVFDRLDELLSLAIEIAEAAAQAQRG